MDALLLKKSKNWQPNFEIDGESIIQPWQKESSYRENQTLAELESERRNDGEYLKLLKCIFDKKTAFTPSEL